jgi:hypothetical protein
MTTITITIPADVDPREPAYTVTYDPSTDVCTISVDTDPLTGQRGSYWVGDGRGPLCNDCAADLGDDVWGAIVDALGDVEDEWRAARGSAYHECECGGWTGERCSWSGPRGETAIVEWVPEEHRESHVAAGSTGSYPHNGSRRGRVALGCAKFMFGHDASVRIIAPAGIVNRPVDA